MGESLGIICQDLYQSRKRYLLWQAKVLYVTLLREVPEAVTSSVVFATNFSLAYSAALSFPPRRRDRNFLLSL